MTKRAVVTGIGLITALGIGREQNWLKIRAKESGIREITSFSPTIYRGKTGGEATEFKDTPIQNLKTRRLDRASLLLIHTGRMALSDAGISNKDMDRVLLSVGTTLGGMLSGEYFHREFLEKGLTRARVSRVLDYLAHSQAINFFKELELKGDFLVFSNACASGASAIGNAFNAIRRGEYSMVICGGYDTMCEFTFAGFHSLMAITPSLCRPFDKNRNGLVLGEGAGMIILEEMERAVERGARILGEIAGYGETADAYHLTGPEPSGKVAGTAIGKAWLEAGKPVIDYINAHGTGTKYNDVMETNALVSALGEKAREIPVSSTKPMMGHLLGGAGAVEAIISLLSIAHKTLPPTLNYETRDGECALNVVTEPAELDIKNVLSNSFGFGGSNAALILKEFKWTG